MQSWSRKDEAAHCRTGGFTLVELIMVMVIVGILAVAALPRFIERQTFDARGFYDQTLAMLRYGQKVAIAQRTNVFVNVDVAGSTICLTYAADPTCNSASIQFVVNPADNARYIETSPNGIALTSTVSSFSFSGLGAATQSAVISISYGGTTHTITVEGTTGYVH